MNNLQHENNSDLAVKSNPYEEKIGEDYTASEADEAMGIKTRKYENGSITKSCVLSDGRKAVCRRLRGKDRIIIKRIIGDNKERMEDAVIAVSTKIDDKDLVLEDIDELWFNDATVLQAMALSINFM